VDTIRLTGARFYAFHGNSAGERAFGQRFSVDLEVERDTRQAGISDDLADTVNYAHLYRAVREVMQGPAHNLLEALAEAIAQAVISGFPVESVRVRVSKPSPPITGAVIQAASVEVLRKRERAQAS
jgi:dihydroneopterin aldolase